ncbi:MAG: hypothetical protein R3C56_13715 [Pirellulaceae bacterium]
MGHILLPKTHSFAHQKSLPMPNALTIPRSTTWETLQKSKNLAAVTTLATGLSSANAELRHLCLQSLLARNEEPARREIVLNWKNYDEKDTSLLRSKRTQFGELTKRLLTGGSLSEKKMALAAIATLDLHDALEEILELVVDTSHALCAQATECLTLMCVRWGAQARLGKDVPTVRGRILSCVSDQLALFHQHGSQSLVDAWLSVVHWDDAGLRSLIRDPRQSAYRAVMSRLRECDRPAVVQLLAGYVARATTPKNVIKILVERRDTAMAIEIAKLSDSHTWQARLKRLRQLPPLASLKAIEAEMSQVNVELEYRLWLMVAASSDDLRQVLRGALRLSKLGTRDARQTAAEMLRLCRRPELEALVPAIQAAEFETDDNEYSLGILTQHIATWLASPSQVLAKAAREFLQDFTVDNLLDQVRHWPTQMAKAMAKIVVLVEPNVTERLTRELQSPAPRRRLAALQATQLLDCADLVSQTLMPLLDDPRLEVRVRTIDLLGALGHEALEQLIPELLADANTDIQDAANRAVRRMKRTKAKVTKQ